LSVDLEFLLLTNVEINDFRIDTLNKVWLSSFIFQTLKWARPEIIIMDSPMVKARIPEWKLRGTTGETYWDYWCFSGFATLVGRLFRLRIMVESIGSSETPWKSQNTFAIRLWPGRYWSWQ
jgi:hypothetical protein